MRLAIISDIHGNLHALEAVLADIARVGSDAVVNLGDVVSGPLDPAGTAERLMPEAFITVRGNHDRWIFEPPPGTAVPVDEFAIGRLGAAHRDWLAGLPATHEIDGTVLLCHGTPASDTTGWLDGWYTARSTTLPDEAFVTGHAGGLNHELFLCGHTHVARSVRLRSGQTIVNPGAVGLQVVHGSPDARYAIVERVNGRWVVELRIVPYDHEAAAAQCAANGFSHWREAIATGWADPTGLF